jgi:alpha-1,2-mannosyltransferase
VILEAGDTGWHKIQSVFAWARMWGGSVALAYALQAATTTALAAALIWLWRSAAPCRLKAAGFCIAAMLATPYSLDYDMLVLAPAIAFFAADGLARGFGSYEKTRSPRSGSRRSSPARSRRRPSFHSGSSRCWRSLA